jgi:aspartyl protease family protein
LGIHPSASEFNISVRTANGTVRAAATNLSMVEVGGLVVRDVRALVVPDEALSENLLGLSFLTKLRRFEYAGGKLVLEQ